MPREAFHLQLTSRKGATDKQVVKQLMIESVLRAGLVGAAVAALYCLRR